VVPFFIGGLPPKDDFIQRIEVGRSGTHMHSQPVVPPRSAHDSIGGDSAPGDDGAGDGHEKLNATIGSEGGVNDDHPIASAKVDESWMARGNRREEDVGAPLWQR
jgi:hypothetical protein